MYPKNLAHWVEITFSGEFLSRLNQNQAQIFFANLEHYYMVLKLRGYQISEKKNMDNEYKRNNDLTLVYKLYS